MARFLATAKDIVVFNRIRELAFAHYAWTADGSGLGTNEEGFEEGQVKEAGSGILAAPRFGISAKHVSKGFEKVSAKLDAIRRRSSPLDPQYRINKIKVDLATMVYQVPDGDGLKHWKVDVDWQSHDTDITTLQMTPMSPAAEKADAGSLPFFEWQLRSPKVGSVVRLYGWPNQKLTIDRETADHRAIVELRVEPARVIQTCDPLQFHGLTEFPGFV